MNFRYTCLLNGKALAATMQALAGDEERFTVRVDSSRLVRVSSEERISWYELTAERKSDGARTVVHRCVFLGGARACEQSPCSAAQPLLRHPLPALPPSPAPFATTCIRRYRDFQALSEQMQASFKGHHLRSSLPELPPRQLKFMVDHNDEAFIEERRWVAPLPHHARRGGSACRRPGLLLHGT
jgi:hypothetical protein